MLEREPRPLTFVNSLGLGDPASTDTIHRRLAATRTSTSSSTPPPAWTLAVCEDLAATGAVDVVDFKGQYGMEVEDAAALGAMYERVVATFPDAILEDPHDLPEVAGPLAPHTGRVSYDAPIHSVDDLATTPVNPIRTVNIKPCRTGGLRALLDLYAHCEAEGIAMYGGGMGENGVGRGQIQLLASIFHPDGPNDVAPSGFNSPTRPRTCPRARCRRDRRQRASAGSSRPEANELTENVAPCGSRSRSGHTGPLGRARRARCRRAAARAAIAYRAGGGEGHVPARDAVPVEREQPGDRILGPRGARPPRPGARGSGSACASTSPYPGRRRIVDAPRPKKSAVLAPPSPCEGVDASAHGGVAGAEVAPAPRPGA